MKYESILLEPGTTAELVQLHVLFIYVAGIKNCVFTLMSIL